MPRAFTRRQRHQNAAFLRALAQTGNARLAARALGVNRSTYTKRRTKNPAFAAEWESALATAPSGRLQLRQTQPGRITQHAEQVYLEALATGANDRAAAAQAGFTHPSFHARANARPAFAREMEIARKIGRDRRLWEAMQRATRRAADHELAILPIPKMTVEQAIHQLHLHRRSVKLGHAAPHRPAKPKPLAKVAPGIIAKIDAIRRGMHYERTGSWRFPDEGEA